MASKPRTAGLFFSVLAATLGLSAIILAFAADDPQLSRSVSNFASMNEAAVSAILRFGRQTGLPLGIVLSKELCSASIEELRIDHLSGTVALDRLAAALPSYKWSLENGTVVFSPQVVSPATTQFLSLKVSPYRIPEDTLQAQAAYEWLNIRASLRPDEGTAFSVLSSVGTHRWPSLSLETTTVEGALDRLVARSKGGAWVLSPIDDIGKAAENRPFHLIDYSVSEDPELPCPELLRSNSRSRNR